MKILFPDERHVVVCKRCGSILAVNFESSDSDDEDSYWCDSCTDYVDEKKVLNDAG